MSGRPELLARVVRLREVELAAARIEAARLRGEERNAATMIVRLDALSEIYRPAPGRSEGAWLAALSSQRDRLSALRAGAVHTLARASARLGDAEQRCISAHARKDAVERRLAECTAEQARVAERKDSETQSQLARRLQRAGGVRGETHDRDW